MDKDKILKKAQKEKNYADEGQLYYVNKGTSEGFIIMGLLYVLFYVSCLFVEKPVILRESLLSLYLCFLSTRAYYRYKYSKSKYYLVFSVVCALITIAIAIETLYWIWVK